MKAFGIILIVAGILMLIFRGFSFTKEKEILDVGPIELNTKEKKNVRWPMYAGGITIIAGVVVMLLGKKK